jgi:sugar lactone lactonase YvrE
MMGGKLTRYDPKGRIERVVKCPTTRIASCALGGPGWNTLYISTGTVRMSEADLAADPLAGSILAMEAPAPGLPEPEFGG